ncbi:hypothetical protein DFH29DRAFT_55726 [Suillus ampliporus]|nr:hypothetical protein DFH29DRAFT_55726 [Suillus ampliporus]
MIRGSVLSSLIMVKLSWSWECMDRQCYKEFTVDRRLPLRLVLSALSSCKSHTRLPGCQCSTANFCFLFMGSGFNSVRLICSVQVFPQKTKGCATSDDSHNCIRRCVS